jgi:hypothetical protein
MVNCGGFGVSIFSLQSTFSIFHSHVNGRLQARNEFGHYFGCKWSANYLSLPYCETGGFLLASVVKAGLRGW